MAHIITVEAKYLKPGNRFRFRNRKTIYTFIEDNRWSYAYRDDKHRFFESTFYNAIVDILY